MFALPIIERELRVRARKPGTIWTRVIVGLVVSLFAVTTLSWAHPRGWGPGAWQPGKQLFDSLSALVFLLCLVEGVRQTADCLSQEKRDGTLGLLFLTDLRGFDIVLGKLVATSLGSFYLLLAVFPAMAIALPAGGLTAGEFWRTQLVLLNTLFLAVAAGMWASARNREENRALTTGLGLIFALAVLPWIFEGLLRGLALPNLSPWIALALADDSDYRLHTRHFWLTLAATHALAWVLLARAARRVELSWRDEPAVPDPACSPETPLLFRPIMTRTRHLALSANPAAWLADRLPTHRGLVWISILLLGFGTFLPWAVYQLQFSRAAVGFGFGLSFALYRGSAIIPLLLLAFVAARSFAEARREGTMELLLSTPLSPKKIVSAHWRALWRQVSVPFWLAVGLFLLFGLSGSPFGRGAFGGVSYIFGALSSILLYLLSIADRMLRVVAVCWLGLFLGLRMRTTTQAIGYSLLWTVAVPSVGSYLLQFAYRSLLLNIVGSGLPWWFWIAQVSPTVLSIAYSVWLAVWARRQLLGRFRELAAGR